MSQDKQIPQVGERVTVDFRDLGMQAGEVVHLCLRDVLGRTVYTIRLDRGGERTCELSDIEDLFAL